ncbi:protein TIC 214-like [Salvia hispanica]|uniref:protein TIC 214-like n=1 Tax=Salvia hispanica TaxID=49212 RepID=UPI002009B720|nr:protein TIC 214-like [Salvia hispanica]
MRAQRRKIVISELFQANAHSFLFFERLQKFPVFSFDISALIKLFFQNWVGKGKAFNIVEYAKEQTKREEKKEKNKRKEKVRIEIAEAWDSIPLAQVVRGCMLLTQSIFRKSILLPLLIITKNIGRILLFELPEWAEDFQEWNREIHLKCTYNGVPLSETEFPKNWLTDGIQIKILFPFCLKPWHKSKLQPSQKDLIENKKEKDDFCFLTIWGMEAELPFGPPRKRPSFFKPIFKEFKKKIAKFKKKYFLVLTVFKEKTKLLQKVSKEIKKWFIGSIFFLKKIIKELSKVNPILLFRLREVEVYKLKELKEEKDCMRSNEMIHKSFSQIASPSWTNYRLTEKKMKDLTDRTSTIRNQIERISKEKKKVTTRIKNLSPNKTSYNAKRFAKWQILKRRNPRLIRKLPSLLKIFIEKIYTDIFVSIVNIPRINTELFLKLTKKFIDKNNQRKQAKINTKKKTSISLISAIKKSLDKISNIKENSRIFYDLSYMSQTYVFYKLSQIQISNSVRSVVQHQRINPFLKSKIKDSFERQGMVHSKLANKKLPGYETDQWKNWLKGHFQYHLSQIRWSKLIPEKWRNRVRQRCIDKKTNLSKQHSYEKDLLVGSKKQSEVYLLYTEKDNFRKYYRYNLLSYKFINYKNKTECFFYRPPFQGNKKQEISYTSNRSKKYFFDIRRNIPIPNDLGQVDIPYMEKPADRKYFDWKIFNFYLRQKVDIDIEAWILIDTNRYQNANIRTNNSPIISKKNILYLMIPETNSQNLHKRFFDWMGMNEKRLKRSISNLEFWLFPEFVLLYKAYKMKPWFIPSKLLLLNLNSSKNINENKRINLLIASNKKHRNEEQKEPISQGDRESVFSQQKDIEENYASSDMKKAKKKKQYKSNTEAELDFFLKHYLLFQLRWGATLNQRMINNIKIYCLLLRLIDPRKITISSIQKRAMSLDIMLIQKNLTLSELMKKGVLIVEPLRLSGKKDGQFIMYQTIGISLLHKSKHQINQKYQEQRYVSKKNLDETILPHQRITKNRDKKHFNLLVPENVLSFKRRRKVRILICFNSKNINYIDRNIVFWNETNVTNSSQVSHENNHLDRDKNKLMKLKLFLWPNYRLEDLACMNRYWFDTNNGSRFSMLRIHLYPRLKFCE